MAADRSSSCAVILAAGGGSRWKAAGGVGHKLLAALPDGRIVVSASIQAAIDGGLPVCVVTGAVDIASAVPAGVAVVHNPRWADGQASSLQAGIAWAVRHGFQSVIVGLGDQPWVGPEAWRAVHQRLEEQQSDHGAGIIVPTFEGRRGQPVGLRQGVWGKLPIQGDAGARILMAQMPELVAEVPCTGGQHKLTDIDTPGDLSSWN
jgi:molybdenum cofactor cytidylyltransferase